MMLAWVALPSVATLATLATLASELWTGLAYGRSAVANLPAAPHDGAAGRPSRRCAMDTALHTEPGGPSIELRDGPLLLRNRSVSEMHNNVYLLACAVSGQALLIDAADDAPLMTIPCSALGTAT